MTHRRLLRGDRIVIATHNKGKLREVAALLAPYGIETVSAGDLGLPEPEETEESFIGNATIKARVAAQASGLRLWPMIRVFRLPPWPARRACARRIGPSSPTGRATMPMRCAR